MKVALYARVSTDDKGQDAETQLFKLRHYAAAKGYEVAGDWVDHASGKDPNRPSFQAMLERGRKGDFSVVIVTKLDRMMRSTRNLLNTLQDMESWHLALECVDQPIQTNNAMGRMMITILGAVAEFERDLISDRVKDGMNRARFQGVHLGRPRIADDKASCSTLARRRQREGGLPLNIKEGKKA